MSLYNIFKELDILNEATNTTYKSESGKQINLADCRVIYTDVIDNRGEYETNSCLDYYPDGAQVPVLTRVQVRVLVTRNNGSEFLGKKTRYAIQLPGGGYDATKDHGSILASAERELYEECNIKLKNVMDTGITKWRYREDPWVSDHVYAEEDRWAGYYSFFVYSEYDAAGDNSNPEELNKWKWLPINDLAKANADLYNKYGRAVNEAWGNEHGLADYTIPGVISYCCENPKQLELIITSNFIKGASAPETHETDVIPTGIKRGRKFKAATYSYVSFSKQLYSHAYRRPEKWGFGIALDRNIIAANYDLTDRDHTYNDLKFGGVYKNDNNQYMIKCDLFGYVEVPENIANIVLKAMQDKSNRQKAKIPTDAKPVRNGKYTIDRQTAWELKKEPVDSGAYRSANSELKNKDFNFMTSFIGGSYKPSQFTVRINEFSKEDKQLILDYLLGETYYNEGEERIWLKNNEPGIDIPKDAIVGIIIPAIVEDDFIKAAKANEALLSGEQAEAVQFLDNYIINNNLKLFVHDSLDAYHLGRLGRVHGITTAGSRGKY